MEALSYYCQWENKRCQKCCFDVEVCAHEHEEVAFQLITVMFGK